MRIDELEFLPIEDEHQLTKESREASARFDVKPTNEECAHYSWGMF